MTRMILLVAATSVPTSFLFAQTWVYPSTRLQREAAIAINPTDPTNIIGTTITFQSDSNAVGVYWSTNGGQNWSANEDISSTGGGADPVVQFDGDGNAYLIYQEYALRRIFLHRSTNGGLTWTGRQLVVELTGQGQNLDRPWMSISPIRNAGGYFDIYICYTVFDVGSGFLAGDIHVSKSINGGGSFSVVSTIPSVEESLYRYHGSSIAVGPDNEVILSFGQFEYQKNAFEKISAYKSTNGGSIFAHLTTFDIYQIGSYNTGTFFLKEMAVRADVYPRVAVSREPGPTRGCIYLTWAGKQSQNGNPDILFRRSTNAGVNWGSILAIDQSTGDQWMPAIDVSPDGVVSIMYYSSGTQPLNPIYTYLKTSTDGGQTFSSNPINVGSSNGFVIESAGQTFVGDYHGISNWFGKSYSLWCENKDNGPNYGKRQIYFRSTNITELTPSGFKKLEISQRDESGQAFGKFAKWNQGQYSNYKAPFKFLFQNQSSQVVKATQDFKPGSTQKYHKWNVDNNVVNQRAFQIDQSTQDFWSVFGSAVSATVQAQLLDGGSGATVDFRDPWFIDFNEPPYGMRNRGQDSSSWYSQSVHNLSTTGSYKGVFLGLDPVNSPNYYRVRAPIVQVINGTVAFFQGWSVSGATLQQVGSNPSGYDQKAVVFNSAGATITAQYTKSNIATSVVVPAGSYTLAGTLTVSSGDTLTLSQGTTFNFPQDAGLVVNGTLAVSGSVSQPVLLTKSGASNWKGVFLKPGSNGTLNYCTISYANQPVVDSVASMTMTNCLINNSTFYDNNFDDNAAIRIYNSSPTISATTIKGGPTSWNGVRYAQNSGGSLINSTIDSCRAGNGIIVQGGSSPTIQGNTLRYNKFHGILVLSNTSGNPKILSNVLTNNGVLDNGTKQYCGIDIYNNSTAKIGSNTISGSLYGIYAEHYSSPTTWWSEGPEELTGRNILQSNTYGLVAYNYSNPMFGDYNLLHGNPVYYGSCNKLMTNTTYNAFASSNCLVLAEGNWWGVSPPDLGKISAVGGSYILYQPYATSGSTCPGGGGGGATLAQTSNPTLEEGSSEATLVDGAFARVRGEYELSKSLYAQVLDSSRESSTRAKALSGLLDVIRQSRDRSIISIAERAKGTGGEVARVAEEVLAGAYLSVGDIPMAKQQALSILEQFPNSDTERNALILLASLGAYTSEEQSVARYYGEQLVAKYGSSIDKGLLAALGLQESSPESISSIEERTDEGLIVSSYPNPFNPSTTVAFSIPSDGLVSLRVYDILGRLVETLADTRLTAGSHTRVFDASRLPSGVYFYEFRFDNKSAVRKIVLAK